MIFLAKSNVAIGQKVLLIKYSDIFIKNPIYEHIKILNDKGYVWFGKLGPSPSLETLKKILFENYYYVILYSSKSKPYLATVEKVIRKQPLFGLPNYYENLKTNGVLPFKTFFKIKSLEILDSSFIKEYILNSTKDPAYVAINNSMASLFILKKVEV